MYPCYCSRAENINEPHLSTHMEHKKIIKIKSLKEFPLKLLENKVVAVQ
jgi:hypothetical protein